MRYTEETYQAFLEELMQKIFAEYTEMTSRQSGGNHHSSCFAPILSKKSTSGDPGMKEVMQASRMTLKFTKKEISSMPQKYQNYITVDVKYPSAKSRTGPMKHATVRTA